METVEIYDLDYSYEGGVLGVGLKHILRCVGEEEKKYHWVMMHIWGGIADLSPTTDMLALEEKINSSPRGIEFSWEDLEELANKLKDAIDILVVGNKQKKPNGVERTPYEYHQKNDITFELFDRGFWIVTSNSEALMERIKSTFNDVRPGYIVYKNKQGE